MTRTGASGEFPDECAQTNEFGQPATCTSDGQGGWVTTYPDDQDGFGGGAFAFLFALALLGGIVATIWKVSTARRMARQSGMSEGDATAMTLLTDDGLEATYLASNLRHPAAAPPPVAPTPEPRGSKSDRLRELQALLDEGMITQQEYDEARRAILGSL